MRYNYILFSAIFLFLGVFLCKSQNLRSTYPVQVTVFMNPPHSLKLSDYYNSATPKLSVTLLNRDLMEPTVDVKLHFSIKSGNGVRLETRDYLSYPTIRLQSGTPYLLSQSDLYPYLNPENMDIQGVLPNGQFPEGMVEMCLFVLEANTNKVLSQTSCARAWVTLNRPPILNLPQNNIQLPFQEHQNILFQWTPRHQGLSNVEYLFSLREIWDETAGYDAAFPYSAEIYSATVRGTSMAYNAMMPSLIEGKRYAWQVQAVARDGVDDLSLFENNGYSEIYGFSITQACYAPQNVRHSQDREQLVVEWEPSLNTKISVVAYRAKGSGDWTVIRGNENNTRIFDLAFGVEYEYRVGSVCSDGSITYSNTYIAILEDWRKQFEISCGQIPTFDNSDFAPLPSLKAGDIFTAGDFPVTVSSVSGSNGTFSGKGWVSLPLFGFVKIAVQFNNIKVNSSLQLADGRIETSYDASEKLIADADRLWHGGDDTGTTKTGAVESKVKANFSIPDGATGEYDASSGKVVITDTDKNVIGTIDIPDEDKEIFTSGNPYTYTVEDKDGKIFVMTKDEKGNTNVENIGQKGTPLPEGSFNEKDIATSKAVVEFMKGEDAYYAFDTWQEYYKTVSLIVNKNKYEFIESLPVACQLIPSGESESVGFKVKKLDKSIVVDSIIFRTKNGYEITPKDGQLHIAGGKENDAQDLFALHPNGKGGYYNLGKLKILSYPKKTYNVVLVAANGTNIDSQSVDEYLNDVYGRVGINWVVDVDNGFEYYSDIHSEGSDLFSKYTDEMKEMNSAYKAYRGGSLDKNTAYIFILNEGSINGKAIAGDMPRGGQFGYAFTGSGEDINRTIAHELGHGIFKLRHIFDGEYGSTAKSMEGKTNNLMDYGDGTHLAKWQWDEIHDPAIFVNPFESDEDGMAPVISNQKLFDFLEKIRRSINEGISLDLVSGYTQTKEEISVGGHRFEFITARMHARKGYVLKDVKYELTSERNIFGKEQFCIKYGNDLLTLIVSSKEDRQHLIDYLYEKRNNSFLLFVSGYGPKEEIVEFFNKNENKTTYSSIMDRIFGFVNKTPLDSDPKAYWGSDFVDGFTGRLKPKHITYMSGHDDIGTSNHRTIGAFMESLYSWLSITERYYIPVGTNTYPNLLPIDNPKYHDNNLLILNTDPNPAGFNQRRQNGKARAKDYIDFIKSKCQRDKDGLVSDTVDVVCHSMGFAHALGIIDEIKNAMKSDLKGLKLGGFYIFAPENASCGSVNLSDWLEVWQYGSNEDNINKTSWLLDGVAPQRAVGGIGDQRAYIPGDTSPQDFLESHYIKNYGWIFNRIQGGKGYITPRK